ncbi:cysteine dioxygenase [Spizellomyces sp. 'palustris']|nr:cysteine dioxygenase [Spizellomyces sp. 'palustris']
MSSTTTSTEATTLRLTNPLPTPKDLDALIQTLHREITCSDFSLPAITRLLQSYTSSQNDYAPYAHFDPSKPYTRNLVDDGNGHFNLMILCWTQGKASPIHDHAGAHCLMKILDGELCETQYEWPKEDEACGSCPMRVTKQTVHGANQVAYIHDQIGLHRISNPSSTRPAISLHLYTPPFDYCKTFCENTGQARTSGRCVFYRDFTKKNPQEAQQFPLPAPRAVPNVDVAGAAAAAACGGQMDMSLRSQRPMFVPSK